MVQGKTALITGGSSGIGLATARLLLASGARVAITGTQPDKLDAALGELGAGAIAIQADVTSAYDRARLYREVNGAFGTLDILFANAGVAFGTPIDTTDEAAYNGLMDVNVKGVFFTIQAVLPLMREGGSIILNTSWLNQVGTPGRSLLSASKAAVRSFARTLSAELLPRRIRVNAVSPGSIETPIHRGKNQTDEEFRAYVERVGAQVPLGRMGRPEEIAAAVLFLASEGSSYMLGAEIVVDGGRAEL
ncbi:SDR family oxidoreductase [Microvirga arsenatis]|uniref:SDR family oxidoreductase n=1 Tax=Microvirga arsenatis TaxID=2692265 RepID=A0ABW9Z288_9HYPH|nr:SDR family oxidoreductase [Microvirga arsenatis]NBJ12992.1 SDR family oxidoreductase [Microvirga arsenatis]NBJ26784.1 SDR family oxidoreductase [Microvirga arsenatis]